MTTTTTTTKPTTKPKATKADVDAMLARLREQFDLEDDAAETLNRLTTPAAPDKPETETERRKRLTKLPFAVEPSGVDPKYPACVRVYGRAPDGHAITPKGMGVAAALLIAHNAQAVIEACRESVGEYVDAGLNPYDPKNDRAAEPDSVDRIDILADVASAIVN